MARKEAIEKLKEIQEEYNETAEQLDYPTLETKHCEEAVEALEMAINSLEVDEAYQLEHERIGIVERYKLDNTIKEIKNAGYYSIVPIGEQIGDHRVKLCKVIEVDEVLKILEMNTGKAQSK